MIKNIEYNIPLEKWGGKSIYGHEYSLMHDFASSEHENMRIEYSGNREAQKVAQCMKRHAVQCKMNIEITQRDTYVYVYKKGRE